MAHTYSKAEIDWLRRHRPLLGGDELAVHFNRQFGTDLLLRKLISTCGNHGIYSGRDTRFKKGQLSHNKGKKGLRPAMATEFKKR